MSGQLHPAVCDRALAPGGAAPEWVHLMPEGEISGRDGRNFALADPGALVLDFESRGLDLAIDYEHQADKPEARLSGPVPAAGWIKELKAAEGGLWGRVEWTATAAEMIARKEYRYLSPSFLFHPRTRQIMRLKGAGLVHRPNFALTALASQETAMLTPADAKPNEAGPSDAKPADTAALVLRLAQLLQLPPDAPVEAILARLEKLLKAAPDPARFVPIEAVAEMLADRRLERATAAEGRAIEKVNVASSAGYITPAMREWALALCKSDESAFDTFCQKSGPAFAHLSRPSLTGRPASATGAEGRDAAYGSDAEAAICAQLGLKPGRLSV